MALSGGQLAGGNSTTKKADNDYYTTNPETVDVFFKRYVDDGNTIDGKVWECACGSGNISKKIIEYFPNCKLVSTDLVNHGYGDKFFDFLTYEGKANADVIITNPPFGLMNDFIKCGLEKTNRYLIYFAKIQTLESVDRVSFVEKSPLKYVYIHRNRQATWKNNEPLDEKGKKWATTMMMAWFVWDKEYVGEPIIRFL